jgi:hypothetical protein
MKSGSLFFLIIMAVVFWSCSTQKQTEPIGTLEHQIINTGEKYLGYGGFLAYCEGDIVGLELHPSVKQPFFNLMPNGEFYFFGSKGRGPNEFLLPYSIQFVDGRTVGVFDAQTKTYSEFIVPNEGEGPKIEQEIRFQSVSSRIIKTAFDQYISLSLNDEKMFSLIDSTGSRVKTFFEYPYQNNGERKVEFRAYAYQGTLTANPSKTKFVYSSFRGEIIHFYSIAENNIEVITKVEKDYPLYKDESNGEIKGVSYDTNGKNGYIATYATDNFVYAIYSGQTVLEQVEKRSVNFEGKTLRVFDWNGLLVKEYELDVPCSYLCVSDDDTKMWAVVTDSDGEIKLASPPLITPAHLPLLAPGVEHPHKATGRSYERLFARKFNDASGPLLDLIDAGFRR